MVSSRSRRAIRLFRAECRGAVLPFGAPALLLLFCSAVFGAVIDVDTTVDDFADNGNCSLREAILAANFNATRDACTAGASDGSVDTIRLPAGLYVVDRPGMLDNFAVDGDLDIRGDLTIEGADAELTVIDGAADERVFDVDPGNAGITVILRRLTVRNGSSGILTGGGIQNKGDLTLEDVIVSDNRTDGQAGGGIYNLAGTLVLEGVVLEGNSGDDGGALFVEGGTTVSIYDSVLEGNTSATSAGAINNNGTLTMDRCLVQGNVATTVKGGGIVNNDTMTIRNSTISGNRAPLGAGGAVRNEGTLTLEHTTIADNSAAQGGAISNFDTVNVDHTILSGNTPDNCTVDALVSGGFNLEDRDDCGLDNAPIPDLVSTDPQLEPLADNGGPTLTYALPASSPAVDAGSDVGCTGRDQRGAPRLFDGNGNGSAFCDIGAFELRPPILVNSTLDAVDASPGDGVCETAAGNGTCTLRAAIQETNFVMGLEDVVLPAGTYRLTLAGTDENSAATGDLDVRDNLRLLGSGAGATIVDGGGLDRVFDFVGVGLALTPGLPLASAVLSDLTVRNGAATQSGALRSDSRILLRRVDVRENQSAGIRLRNGGDLLVIDSWIRDNQGGNGGGLYTEYDSRAVIRRTTISGNQASGTGGGAELDGVGVLENVTVSGNTANTGGGLFTGPVTILSSTIAGNTATSGFEGGGGLFLIGDTFFHNTVVANNVVSSGPTNCVRSGAVVVSRGYNLESDDTCALEPAEGDLLDTVPLLAPLRSEGGFAPTHGLLAGSPALESGDPLVCPSEDGRRFARPVDGDNDGTPRCDRGAFEAEVRRFTIDTPTDGVDVQPGDGACATVGGSCTVRAAIQEANAWGGTDEVFLPAGTYTLSLPGVGESLGMTGDLDIRSSLIVRGAGARSSILDADHLDRVLDVSGPGSLHVAIESLTLRNGFTGEYGAGIRAPGLNDSLALRDVAVLDSTAAGTGGREGGGLYAGLGELTIDRSLLAGNVATDGGGLYLLGNGVVTITNTTISDNAATGSPGYGEGGGVYVDNNVDATFVNVALVGNHADLEGGGLYARSKRPLLSNTLLAANTATNCSSVKPESAGFNLEDGNDCDLNGGADTTSLVDTDPLLDPLTDNGGPTDTYALLPGSPAIDAGDNASCPSFDQRGVHRPLDWDGDGVSRCDIGPYERGLFGDGFESGDTSAWSRRAPG